MTEEEKRITERRIARKKKRQKELLMRVLLGSVGMLALVVILVLVTGKKKTKEVAEQTTFDPSAFQTVEKPAMKEDLLPINPYSRAGDPLEEIHAIVIHYTGNPGTTAKQNRDYFASLAETHSTSASSHFVIGLEGEIIQCIPCNEIAYASNERNVDSISIECCIEEESGRFNSKTYGSLVELTAWLMQEYNVGLKGVIRHYDVTGKECPRYYVKNETSWRAFKSDVEDFLVQK